jgi:hypothetical protein
MSTTSAQLLEQVENPERLEEMYQNDPTGFRVSLKEASTKAPDSLVLRAWTARLKRGEETAPKKEKGDTLWIAIAIAVAVGLLFRLPSNWLDGEWFYPRLGPLIIILGPISYFLLRNREQRLAQMTAGVAVLTAVYAIFLPDPETSDSAAMALIHVPAMFALMLGAAFLGESKQITGERTRFVSYLGELVVLTVVVGLGGLVLSGLTIMLFSLIGMEIEEWFMENIGLACAAAVPVGATYLFDNVLGRKSTIAPALARVFSPLFLVMVTAYLIAALVQTQNPFIDRDFLIVFNGLLLLVLGITVFSLVGRKEPAVGWLDYVNVALVAVTLMINSVALSAILFRLVSFGFTPNRVVVLGANITILIHLVHIFRSYLTSVRRRDGFPTIDAVIGTYLPVYSAWAAIVLFVLPLVFGFK